MCSRTDHQTNMFRTKFSEIFKEGQMYSLIYRTQFEDFYILFKHHQKSDFLQFVSVCLGNVAGFFQFRTRRYACFIQRIAH